MQLVHKWFWGVLLTALTLSGSAASKTDVKLVMDSETARPGDTVMAGLVMKMPSSWHTYWRNSGDSGGPTEIAWQLPEGITAGAIQWPAPEKLVMAGLATDVFPATRGVVISFTIFEKGGEGGGGVRGEKAWVEWKARMWAAGCGENKGAGP